MFKRLFWLCTGMGFGFGSSFWLMRAMRRTVDRWRPTRVVARLEGDVRTAVAEGRAAAREREAALRAARAARTLVATPRALDTLTQAGVQLDVLVGSAHDPSEVYEPGTLDPEPRVLVRTRGGEGGEWSATGDEPLPWLPAGRRRGRWEPTPLPGEPIDAYGCGDSFAAGLTYGLGAGMGLEDAIELGAHCGAACLCGRGPYAGQLELAER
jgi:ribokinase